METKYNRKRGTGARFNSGKLKRGMQEINGYHKSRQGRSNDRSGNDNSYPRRSEITCRNRIDT